jgi:hypothetical protein
MTTQTKNYYLYTLKNLLWVIFFASLISSCKTDTKKFDAFNESDFSETVELKYSVLKTDQMLMRPINIHIYGDFLILQNLGPKYFYEVYDLNTNKRINECINAGQGPGEMIAPKIVDIRNNRIWIYDRGKISLFEYKLEDFISSNKPEINKTMKLNFSHDKTWMSENIIITSRSENLGYRFDFYNSDGKLLYSKGEYPPHSPPLSKVAESNYYDFNFTISADSKIFVTHYYTDLIEIHDMEGNLTRRRQGPNQYKPKFKEASVGRGGYFYRPVRDETYQCYSFFPPVSVGNEIFVLYFGDLYQNFEERCDRILVFDSDGNPLRIYKLKIPVISFTVDSEKRIIYAITDKPEKEEDEYNLIKYEY